MKSVKGSDTYEEENILHVDTAFTLEKETENSLKHVKEHLIR